MKKIEITDMHGETVKSLMMSRTKYQHIPKAERKINTILMCIEGQSAREIEKLLHICYQTASKYIKTFNEKGLEGLLEYKMASGRPPILSEQEQDFCKEMFQLTPAQIGLDINTNWNARIMQDFIEKEFGKRMTKTAIQEMLHRMGFSYTRPTYVLAKADKKNS